MQSPALGILEFNSIAQGIISADAALKKSTVDVLISRTICPGKYLVVINGDIDQVKESVRESETVGGYYNIDSIVIPNLDPQIPPALSAMTEIKNFASLGILETYSAPSAILSADAAVKAADVELIEVRIANGIGGKSFYTLTGNESQVRAALDAGAAAIEDTGLLMNMKVIPSPHEDLYEHLI